MTTLDQIGERRLVAEYLMPRYGSTLPNFGDDAAILAPFSGDVLVATTDPCPEPAASLIGDSRPETFGHLLATINLSDLAAVGAEPIGLLFSLELPGHTDLNHFLRILDGVDRCCEAAGTQVRGGNLRASSRRAATGFAIGACDTSPMSRSGARPGDLVVAFGSMGLAWARILSVSHGVPLTSDELDRTEATLVWPRAKLRLGRKLRESQLVHACTDASDGLMAAIAILAGAAGVGTELELGELAYDEAVHRVAKAIGIHPWCIARTWGDWQLVCAVAPQHADEVALIAEAEASTVTILGSFVEDLQLSASIGSVRGEVNVLDSERFAHSGAPLLSWYPDAVVGLPPLRAVS